MSTARLHRPSAGQLRQMVAAHWDAIAQGRAGARLRDLDVAGYDFVGATLRRADLTGSDLSGCDLTGADLCGARLAGARLHGARLEATDLNEADLAGAVGDGVHVMSLFADPLAPAVWTADRLWLGDIAHPLAQWRAMDESGFAKTLGADRAAPRWPNWPALLALIAAFPALPTGLER